MRLYKLDRNRAFPGTATGVFLPQPAQLDAEAPDETWCLIGDAGQALGGVSLWWQRSCLHQGRRTGRFGHFSSAGRAVSVNLLRHALERLHAERCELAAGPINGSTWYKYRLVTDPGTGPEFPLDVHTPPEWCEDYRAAGLEELETYCSVSLEPPPAAETDAVERERRVTEKGILVRTIDMNAPVRDLSAIWSLSMECFSFNPFFTPIEEQAFLDLYRPFLTLMDPEYVLLAEDEKGVCAFHFAFPYQTPDSRRNVVSKTMAVHPRVRGTGVGSYLLHRILARASSEGAHEIIMAFMHERNLSAAWARKHGRVIRRYAVFGKILP
ncbi:MAG: N-acetyltransferase family protein [Alphaproteobacteria bacterium]